MCLVLHVNIEEMHNVCMQIQLVEIFPYKLTKYTPNYANINLRHTCVTSVFILQHDLI